jgi:hypothetical protein
MITIYGYSPSGNCHKLRMLLGHLGCDYRWIEIESPYGGTRTPEYLAKNPNGKVPMIETDDGRVMVESNAIRKNGKPPSTNAEARLGAPSAMTTTEISGIVVNKGGVLNVYLAPVTGTDHGLVQYTPKIVTTKKGKDAVQFSCTSPNIPEIATIAPACKYQPANQPASEPKKK